MTAPPRDPTPTTRPLMPTEALNRHPGPPKDWSRASEPSDSNGNSSSALDAEIPFSGQLAAPAQRLVDRLLERYSTCDDGVIASYIPELSKADPAWFGIAIAAMDGHVYTSGDSHIPFTIQSISKPFVYGLALEDHGWDAVLARVGLEPTGDVFNAISLDPVTGRPANPMVNAGAIATTALIEDRGEGAINRIVRMLSRYAGRELEICESTYRSERDTGHRNRAIGHLLRNSGRMSEAPDTTLENYFKQCSVLVTCRDLAVMAATLANGGLNPVSGERAIESRYVDSVLSVMETCGMYNYAGEWKYRVGMPAKSGVAGGILAPLVGQIGVGVFSPLLDSRGNSVRAVHVCDDLSRGYRLHMLNVPDVSRSALRAAYDLTEVRSKRHRTDRAEEALSKYGHGARIYELQGQLNFAAVESFSRQVAEADEDVRYFAFDFKRVLRADPGAAALFLDLLHGLLESDCSVAVADPEHVPGIEAPIESLARERPELELSNNLDQALEWCENLLLDAVGLARDAVYVPIEENEFFAELGKDEVERLIAKSVLRNAKQGQVIVAPTSRKESLVLLIRGHASVTMDLPGGEHVRLDTNPPGTAYGELLLVDDSPPPATLVADTDVEYYELPLAVVLELGESDPRAMATIMRNVAADLAAALRSSTAEIHALHVIAPTLPTPA